MSKLLFTTTAACALALAPGALAQRAIRPADAPTPEAVPQPAAPAAPEVEPLVPGGSRPIWYRRRTFGFDH